MNDAQMIELAFLIKEEEDKELEKLLEQAQYQFVSLLLEYILSVEAKLEDAFQTDYEELQEIVDKIVSKFTKKAPTEKQIRNRIKKRSLKKKLKDDVVPELEAAFFVLLDAFKEQYGSYGQFDSKSEAYQELKGWMSNLPALLMETTDNAVVRRVERHYEDEEEGGISLEELAVFGYVRARSIAILEILRMYGCSQFEAMMLNSHVIGVTWRHTDGVKEPREAHVEADGYQVAKGQFFLINGEYLRYPRDPQAPIEETINCHCYLEPIFDRARNEVEYEIEIPEV